MRCSAIDIFKFSLVDNSAEETICRSTVWFVAFQTLNPGVGRIFLKHVVGIRHILFFFEL